MEREDYHSRAGDAIGRLGFNHFYISFRSIEHFVERNEKVVVSNRSSGKGCYIYD
jgi:hypothetical protein